VTEEAVPLCLSCIFQAEVRKKIAWAKSHVVGVFNAENGKDN
jgi:hypothetical protein